MKLSELGPKSPVTIASDASITDAARLMDTANVGALVVMDGDRLAGIVTDRDLAVRAVGRGVPSDGRIDGVMTTDVVTIAGDADGKLVGIISLSDILQYDDSERAARTLREVSDREAHL